MQPSKNKNQPDIEMIATALAKVEPEFLKLRGIDREVLLRELSLKFGSQNSPLDSIDHSEDDDPQSS